MNKQEKTEVIDHLKERFAQAKAVVLTDYKGLTVSEMSEMRKKFRSGNIEYRVIKNTLAKIASNDTPMEPARDYFEGPVGIAIGFEDPVALAKNVVAFSKENEKFKVKCGVIEGALVQEQDLKKIATLPSRNELLSMMLRAFSAPMSKLAAGLNAIVSQLGYALEALKAKKTE